MGNVGLLFVRGSADEVRLVRARRAWALFVGLTGIRWASLRLPPAGRASPPDVGPARPPPPPRVAPVQSFEPQLSVSPPIPP